MFAAGVTGRSPGVTYHDKCIATSQSLLSQVNGYRAVAPLVHLAAPSAETLYTSVSNALPFDGYVTYAELMSPGTVPLRVATSSHQAIEGAKKGNQGDISGTSGFRVRYVECTKHVTVMATLSLASHGSCGAVYPTISVPSHTCDDSSCPVRQGPPSSSRMKKDLLTLLDAAFNGGAAVRVGASGKYSYICPCQLCP